MKKWDDLPDDMRNESVRHYYVLLSKKRRALCLKRTFDLLVGIGIAIVLLPVMLVLAAWIKLDSKGPVLFKQKRVTTYGRMFWIYKFRTMVVNAEQLGSRVTVQQDNRITNAGKFLRKFRLDELPQVFNVIKGDMSFVGTRPEVPEYVREYTDEMWATLLLPAGITSMASIMYKDEERLLSTSDSVNEMYIHKILPEKMKYNLRYLEAFTSMQDLKLMFKTIAAIIYQEEAAEQQEGMEVHVHV